MTAAAVIPETESSVKTLVRRPSQVTLLRPIAPAAEVIAAQNETRELIAKALQKGRDYGTIKGTDKPTLYKAGAERVALAFGCFAQFRTLESEVDHDREVKYLKRSKNWNNKFKGDKSFSGWREEAGISLGLYRYVVECQIVHRETGEVVGSFMGSCSSLESKYIDRPRDVENTIIKMAEKRALVGAALTTFGLSDQFTQDVEDLDDNRNANVGGEGEEEAVVEIVKDLAWAKAFPLPFPKHTHYNEPIETRDAKELQGFYDWCGRKIEEAGAKGEEPSTMLTDFKAALKLVLDEKKAVAERDQTKLDLRTESDIASEPTTGAAEKAEARGKVTKPGKVADAIEPVKEDPTSVRAEIKRIEALVKHPGVKQDTKDAYHRDKIVGFKQHPSSWWFSTIEKEVAESEESAESRADKEGFPEALKGPDNDGLPF